MIEQIVMDSKAGDDEVHQDQKYKALAILILFVHDDIINHITNVKESKYCWKIFINVFEIQNVARTFFLINKLHSM
jgi:hypothetical protein